MLIVTLLALVAAAVPATAANYASAPIKRVANFTSFKNVVENQRFRLAQLSGNADGVVSGPITNEDILYSAPINIGNNTWELVISLVTGSTVCGAQQLCEPTPSGVDTGKTFFEGLGSSLFTGEVYHDTVSFAGLKATNQSIGAATNLPGFDGFDGVIGFGPLGSSSSTAPSNLSIAPSFLTTLKREGKIAAEIVGLYFQPEIGGQESDTNGELTLGGIDDTKYTGSIAYIPKLTENLFWNFNITGFGYGTTKLLSTPVTAFVDTSTTLIYLPHDAYQAFTNATGGRYDFTRGLTVFHKMPTENFTLTANGHTMTLTPAQYLVPKAQRNAFGLQRGKHYSWITKGDIPGFETVIGQKFIESYYTVLDTEQSRIGFAPAVHRANVSLA